MTELVIVLVAVALALFAIGTMIHHSISTDVKKMGITLEDSTNTIKPASLQPTPDCICTSQGASGWRCGDSPCGATERLVTHSCTPAGCMLPQGVPAQECVEDPTCCTDFQDTNFCGTGGPEPDCPIGARIVQKTCGNDTATYECRRDLEPADVDRTPSCQPHCLGEYSPNEAAAIVNPSLPVICPGDDADLASSRGPWVRDPSGVGIATKILGQSVDACRHPPTPPPDEKCEVYCLTGYVPNPNGLSCDPVACHQDAMPLNDIVAAGELPQGSGEEYTYKIPAACPVLDENSYILFNVILGEVSLSTWNNAAGKWETPTTSGDNNNMFQSFKLYPLGSDSTYFNKNQIRWKVSQATGDKDSYFVNITAAECATPPVPQNFQVQNPGEVLMGDAPAIRSFVIPKECNPLNEGSYFSANFQLNNATLHVFDVNADTWSEVASSGKNNKQTLSLKYHPMGLEGRFFNGNEIMWRISKARGSTTEDFSAGITVADCYVSLCSGSTPKEGWVTAAGSASSCSPVCASVGLNPGLSPEGMACASGENRPMSGTGIISYTHGCSSGLGCNGNLPGPTQTHFSDVNCYRNGQTEDGQSTDLTVACYCQQ